MYEVVNQSDSISIKQKQIENYKNGTGLIFSVHVTHHGRTTMTYEMGKWGPVPGFPTNNPVFESIIHKFPWKYKETAYYTDLMRQYYHFISEEMRSHPKYPLQRVNWEYENLLSVYVTRHPLDRLLSGDGILIRDFGEEEDRTEAQLHGFAERWQADNYAMAILSVTDCVKENNITIECLGSAKTLLQRFTFVLDQACLNEGIQRMAQLLNKQVPESIRWDDKVKSTKATAKERIPYSDVYDKLLEKNKRSIKLYEWSKSISLVQCHDA